jgi:hypothetical protein
MVRRGESSFYPSNPPRLIAYTTTVSSFFFFFSLYSSLFLLWLRFLFEHLTQPWASFVRLGAFFFVVDFWLVHQRC